MTCSCNSKKNRFDIRNDNDEYEVKLFELKPVNTYNSEII